MRSDVSHMEILTQAVSLIRRLKKSAFRSLEPRFLEVAHGSGHGFSGAEAVCDLVPQLRGEMRN